MLKPETASVMISVQTPGRKERWGFGWSVRGDQFAKGCSPLTFGHSGSTGTLCWLDPENDVCFVLLTTKPADHSNKVVIQPVSELVAART